METENLMKKVVTFMDGVPTVIPVTDPKLSEEIIRRTAELTGWNLKDGVFPATVPVPMTRANMNLLLKNPYLVGPKYDGTRYLMLVTAPDQTYFINRLGEVFLTSQIKFPSEIFYKKTGLPTDYLLDGEMVLLFPNSKGVRRPVFKIFDCICSKGHAMRNFPFVQRMDSVTNVIAAREVAISSGLIKAGEQPFDIVKGPFYTLKNTREVWQMKLDCKTDGLVFMPTDKPYNFWPTVPGVNEHYLKWKPGELNTVDFELQIDRCYRLGYKRLVGRLCVSGSDAPFGMINVTPKLKQLNGKIIECHYYNNSWVFLKERWDRDTPNTLKTANDTVQSIKDSISLEELFGLTEDGLKE